MVLRLWWLPGALMVLFGVLIAAYPQLLALFVAAAFIAFGVSTLLVGVILAGGWHRSATPIVFNRAKRQRIYTWFE